MNSNLKYSICKNKIADPENKNLKIQVNKKPFTVISHGVHLNADQEVLGW